MPARPRPAPLLALLLLACGDKDGDDTADDLVVDANAYQCSCECSAGGYSLIYSFEVCLPDEDEDGMTRGEMEDHCAGVICPAMEIVASDWAAEHSGGNDCDATCEPAEGEDMYAEDTGVVDGVDNITWVDSCEEECEEEECVWVYDEDANIVVDNFDVCTQVDGDCGTSDSFCRPDESISTARGGAVADLTGLISTIRLDPEASSLLLSLTAPGGAVYSGAVALEGEAWTSGAPLCPGAACDLPLDLSLFSVGSFEIAGLQLQGASIRAGTGSYPVAFDADGQGAIPVGRLASSLSVEIDGIRYGLTEENPRVAHVSLDPDAGTFSLDLDAVDAVSLDLGFGVEDYAVSAALQLQGELVNQPPRAGASDDVILACAPAEGVELDASATSDPDGLDDVLYTLWFDGAPAPAVGAVSLGNSSTVQVYPMAGQNVYSLAAVDAAGQTTYDRVLVAVEDESQPAVISAAMATDCVAPTGGFVRLELGADLLSEISDDCADEGLSVSVVGVRSDEPDAGVFPGDQAGDARFDDDTICLRAEADPQGDGRTYTIELAVRDSAGNTSLAEVEVRAPLPGPSSCALDPFTPIPEGDPLCEL